MPSQAQPRASTIRNTQKNQYAAVRLESTVSPACEACEALIPSCAAAVWLLISMIPDSACPTSGMIAPAASAQPSRAGRQKAATATTATSAAMTATLPAMTQPGLENAFPSVMVSDWPDELVRR